MKAGENRADGALDRRAGAATEVSIQGGTCNRDRVSPWNKQRVDRRLVHCIINSTSIYGNLYNPKHIIRCIIVRKRSIGVFFAK